MSNSDLFKVQQVNGWMDDGWREGLEMDRCQNKKSNPLSLLLVTFDLLSVKFKEELDS